MLKFESYQILEIIKNKYFVDVNDTIAIKILEDNISEMSNALQNDFKLYFDTTLILDDAIIYFGDDHFKQGATAYCFNVRFSKDDKYRLSIECLVDFGKIGIKARNEPSNENTLQFHQKIRDPKNAEGFVELRTLYK